MKKHLIAAAVAAAIAVPAAAQVSVYGMVSAELQKTDTQNGRDDSAISESSSLGSPVIGFRGSEDLGGGLKAEFQLESGLNQQTGATSLFSRQNWVGVSGGFGAIRVGFQNNAIKDIDGFGETGANLFDVDGGLQNRDRRTVKYISPSLNGFTFALSNSNDVASTSTANANGIASSASATTEMNAFNAQYSAGPLKLAAGQGTSKTAAGFERENTIFGGSYNLGMALVDFSVQSYESSTSANGGEFDLMQIGANIPLGKVNIKVNYTNIDYNGTSTEDSKYTGIMAVYSLSKRSNIFAGYRAESGKDNADVDVGVIGINHSF